MASSPTEERTAAAPARRWRAIALAVAAVYLATGIFFVPTDQQALAFVMGAVRQRPYEPGLHWTWPRPIGRIVKLKVRETKRIAVGYQIPERVLEREPQVAETQFMTGDRNLLAIRVVVQYVVRDPVAYQIQAGDIQGLIGSTAESALSKVVVERHVDDVLTTGKVAVQADVQTHCQRALDRYQCGVSVLGVNLELIQPPADVMEAFRDVASAREDRSRIVRQAESYANETLALARGEATRRVTEAGGYRDRVVAAAEGEAVRFSRLAAEYRLAPQSTATRLYLEVLEEVLPRLRVNLVDPGAGPVELDLVQPGKPKGP